MLVQVENLTKMFGGFTAVRYDGTAKANFCGAYIASNGLTAVNTSADFSCNPDFNIAQIGVITRWTPVKNLTFSAEVQYFRLDQNFSGTAVLTPAAPKPSTVYEFKDQNTVFLEFRAQRNF